MRNNNKDININRFGYLLDKNFLGAVAIVLFIIATNL